MRKYFIINGYLRLGPYTVEELLTNGITAESLIWTFEFGDPKPAKEINEIWDVLTKEKIEKTTPKEDLITKEIDDKKLSDKELLEQAEIIKKENEEKRKLEQKQKLEQEKRKKIEEEKQKELKLLQEINNKDKQKNPLIVGFNDKDIKEDKNLEITDLNKKVDVQKVEKKVKIEKINIDDLVSDIFEKNQKIVESKTVHFQNQNVHYSSNMNYGSTKSKKPPTYIIVSLISMLACCLPLGLVGLINGSQVDKKYNDGDYIGAQRASNTARIMFILSLVFGVMSWGFILFVAEK